MPADGTVINGISEIDESLVTGETLTATVRAGATIYAGSINVSGALTVRVTAAGAGTLVDEVERLLDKATQAKSRTVAARRSRGAVLRAGGAYGRGADGDRLARRGRVDSRAIVTAIAVLIITCPCALALAIPAVQVVAAGALFRAGLILNGGDAIERLAEADTVVFDKTGTLTLPEPRVDDDTDDPPDVLERAARLALSSRHPLAAALARHARERDTLSRRRRGAGAGRARDDRRRRSAARQRRILRGRAGCASGRARSAGDASFINFVHAGTMAAIAIRQTLRPDAARRDEGARASAGFDLMVLSGDREAAVAPVANELGIADWRGGLTPAEKIAVIEMLKSQGRRVLMVGDGLNDAPALAAAHVSMSPITAAHLTQAHADALFLGDHLAPVLSAVVICAPRPRLDEAEPRARRDLQHVCRAAGDCRHGNAADRRGRDVGVFAPRDAQRLARADGDTERTSTAGKLAASEAIRPLGGVAVEARQ